MRLISDRLPDLARALPDLCPTFAQPQSRRRKALPDLPNLIARAYMEMQSSYSFETSQSGWVGWVGWADQAAARVSSCPTSAQPRKRLGRGLARVLGPGKCTTKAGVIELNEFTNGEMNRMPAVQPSNLNPTLTVQVRVKVNAKLNVQVQGSRVLPGLGRVRVIRTPLFMHLSFRALVPNGTGMAA
ncbi:hypothetical protein VC253_01425 [Xanthomonas campestris]|uniref:hypothetical protein n=1 Tax=Xanthomonas campestris TaxID=339 RepID=UPI002B228668|nr:hypothetical protein [Xanthomonas campestris]MEA9550523.1 hypothetical protein [Xanthomonas campestris]